MKHGDLQHLTSGYLALCLPSSLSKRLAMLRPHFEGHTVEDACVLQVDRPVVHTQVEDGVLW